MVIIQPDPPVLYCDESRRLGQNTTVAGAIASVQDWLDFDVEWRQALRDNGLRYFRMSEFANSRGEFRNGWKRNETRRQEFFLRLAQIIVDHVVCWVGASVSQKDYEAADKIYQLHGYSEPYTVCGLTCVGLAYQWRDANHLDYLPLEYVFEDGDQHAGQLWQRCKEWYGEHPIFRQKLSDDVNSNNFKQLVTPLQVGDIAAYEIGKAYSLLDPNVEALFVHFRTSFGLLGSVPHKWGELHETTLRAEMNMRGVPRR
jgi:hypothetical protein